MTPNRTHDCLVDIFRDVLNLEDRYSREQILLLSRTDAKEWDSMQMVNLLLAIEEEFAVRIPDEVAYTLDSFPKFEDFLALSVAQ